MRNHFRLNRFTRIDVFSCGKRCSRFELELAFIAGADASVSVDDGSPGGLVRGRLHGSSEARFWV